MKILYIAHRLPYPPNKGEKIRAFNQIKHLAENHEVHLACMIDRKDDLQHIPTLRKWCQSVETVYRAPWVAKLKALLALPGSRSMTVESFYSRDLQRKIDALRETQEFDRILAYSTPMAEYVKNCNNTPKLLDLVDVDSEKWKLFAKFRRFPMSWLFRLEGRRLADYEDAMAAIFDQSLLVSDTEAALLRGRTSKPRVSVNSIGVDFEYYVRPPVRAAEEPVPQTIVFTGMMNYYPNVNAVLYFCESIFPLIRDKLPHARFLIVGRSPTSDVRALSKLDGVDVTGEVPDVRPYIGEAGVSVAPFLLARGLQTKIIESMALAVPVVGTTISFQGIRIGDNDGVRMADDPNAFAREVVELLTDSGAQLRASGAARKFVEQCHQWDSINREFERLIIDDCQTTD